MNDEDHITQWIDAALEHESDSPYTKSRFDYYAHYMDLALHWAIQHENVELAKKALSLGATWQTASYTARSPYSFNQPKFRNTYLKMRELYFPEAPPI